MAAPGADAATLAAIHGSIGNAYVALGPPEKAREHLTKALELARKAEATPLTAALLTNLGNLDASKQAYAEAARDYAESAALAEKAGDPTLAARALANQAQAAQRSGAPPGDVRAALARASAFADDLPDSHEKAYLLISAGRTYARLPRHRGGARAGCAVRDAVGDRDRRRARAVLRAGLPRRALRGSTGRLDEALALSRRALFLAQQANAPESLYRWHWQMGRILAAQGARAEAIASYQPGRARALRHPLRHGARLRDRRRILPRRGGPRVLRARGPAARDRAGPRGPPAIRRACARRARRSRSSRRRSCATTSATSASTRMQAKVESLDVVARSAVVIYPVVLPDRLELLLTFPSGMRRATVPVARRGLTAEVRRLRTPAREAHDARSTCLTRSSSTTGWCARSRPSSQALGADTLVFVPDGPLRTIPMGALHDGEHFLIERYAVVTTPGLSLTDPRPLARQNASVFVSGLSESVQGFPALAHVREELDSIHALYGGEILLDEKFQTPRVEAELGGTRFGTSSTSPHTASSRTTPSAPSCSPGTAASAWIASARRSGARAFAISRSSCWCSRPATRRRAATARRSGSRALRSRRARAARSGHSGASTTSRPPSSSANSTRQLHAQSVSKAVALQRAQQKLAHDPKYEHPYYWAPYLLIGNWL